MRSPRRTCFGPVGSPMTFLAFFVLALFALAFFLSHDALPRSDDNAPSYSSRPRQPRLLSSQTASSSSQAVVVTWEAAMGPL